MTPASPTQSAAPSRALGRPAPVVTAREAPTDEPWTERLLGAIPLFAVGTVCLGVAADLYYAGVTTDLAGIHTARIAPWVLFVALGVTGLAAGIFAMLVEDEPELSPPTKAAPSSKAPTTPAWDESNLVAEKGGYVRPRTWEQYPELPTEVGWTSVEPRVDAVPPDVVLIQIDEIAASLKKKPPPSSPH